MKAFAIEFTFMGGVRGEKTYYFSADNMIEVMNKAKDYMHSPQFRIDTGEVKVNVTRLRILELGRFIEEKR